MELLQLQGKIKYWGLSLNTFYPEPEANFMMQHNMGQGFQLVYNIINQRAKSLLTIAKQNNYGIIARMPLQFGLLTGKFSTQSKFEKDDHRSFRFNDTIMQNALQLLEEKIWPLCTKYGVTKTTLALSFILHYEAISTVIPGIRTAQHVMDNTQPIIKLEQEDVNMVESLFTTDLSKVVDAMEKQG
jgi:aryl-alcohol dehydrogenase-like predicted oxidoreductase